jgi:nitroreductase
VDAYQAIVSKRDTRRYADGPVPADVEERVLQAGRISGSARNRQPWRFLVIESDGARAELAEAVYAPENVRGARLVVVIVSSGGMDTGRCAQNMMLAAWNDGVASCPNGIADADRARSTLGLGEEDAIGAVLTFGYPANGRTGDSRSVEEWIGRADRKPLDELVTRL